MNIFCFRMAAAIANGHSELHFEPVEKKSELFPVIKEELQKRTLVYGEQETTLKKLEEGSDRSCELLLKDAKPVTLLIYKTNPISKTENVEVINSFEVKTFLPIDKSSISKYLSKTLDRAIEIAKEKQAENIHLTCSEREKPTFNFLINNNFKVCETWDGKYVDGVKEFLMYKSLKDIKDEESKCAEKKLDEKNKMEPVKSEDDNNKKRRYNEDEHHDDFKRPRYEKSHEKSSSSRDRDWRGHQRNNGQRQGGYQRPEGVDDSCTLMKKYVHYIKDGRKTVEGRLNVPMFQKWREGMCLSVLIYPNVIFLLLLIKCNLYL